MVVRYMGTLSSEFPLPGGCQMGDPLGQLLFLVDMSESGKDLPVPMIVLKDIEGS